MRGIVPGVNHCYHGHGPLLKSLMTPDTSVETLYKAMTFYSRENSENISYHVIFQYINYKS
jgi:hypothetical protein